MIEWVPLSVRHGDQRKRFGWWLKGRRERIALRVAPWLEPFPPDDYPPEMLTPGLEESKALGCTCEWYGGGAIVTFDRDCPIRHRHRLS